MTGQILDELRLWADSLGRVLLPVTCEVCGRTLVRGEEVMCIHCLAEMPRVEAHAQQFSIIHKRLASPGLPVEKAASWFYYYRDNPYARMLQAAKYNGRPRLARALGRAFAAEIASSGFFTGIDAIVPMPLAPLRRLARGFNQSEEIARGVAQVIGLPLMSVLRGRSHSSQTRLGAYGRWLNTRSTFSLRPEAEVGGLHLLVVDDILTTGATMLGALEAIHTASPSTRLSVLTLGLTHLR